MFRLTSLFVLVTLLVAPAHAQYRFDLVQDDSTVLATLTLGSFSTDVPDIVSLTFSDAGEDLFGFGPTYTGTFDDFSPQEDAAQFILTGDGLGLTGRTSNFGTGVTAFDADPPSSARLPESPSSVEVFAFELVGADDGIRIRYRESPEGLTQTIVGFGEWTLVPEPSSSVLASLLLVPFLVTRKKRCV